MPLQKWVAAGLMANLVAIPAFAQIAPQEAFVESAPADAPAPEPLPAEAAAPYDTIAVAPETPPEAAPQRETPGNRFIEEVVVTAQKREQNLQEVPISIQAFSAEQLDAMGINDPTDLQSSTPGLTVGSNAGFAIIYLRGVGSDAFLLADPSVATYIDGIYFPFSSGLAQSFGALERIEVLKGPQGTLFGRNTTGGALNIITKSPSQTQETSIQASYGSYDTWKTRVYTNLPLTDTLAVSASGLYETADNYYEFRDDSPLQAMPREVSRGARLKALWQPLDDVNITLGYFRLAQDGFNTALQPNTAPSDIARLLTIQPQPRDYKASVDAPVSFEIDNTVLYGQAAWSNPWFDVKLLGSDQKMRNQGHTDFDGSPRPIMSFSSPLFADVKTAELQVLSNRETPGAERFEWITGLYYIKAHQGLTPSLSLLGGEQGEILGIPIGALLDALPDALLDLIPDGLPSLSGVTARLSGVSDLESTAFFAQGTGYLTDKFSIILGGRYQTEERTLVESSFGLQNFDGGQLTLIPFAPANERESNFSPKVSLNYKILDDALLYTSWQKGFKSGTYNVINIYDQPEYVKPEEITAYELGLKTELFGKLVRFNAAVFQSDIEQLQVQFISLLSGGSVTLENAAGARIRGVDFDMLAQLFPDTIDNLVLMISGAFLDAKYTDYQNGSGFFNSYDINGNVRDDSFGIYNLGTGNYTGNELVRTPKFSGTLGLSKTFDTDWGPIELAGDAYYTSSYYYLPQNSEVFKEDGYTLFNARISYLYEPSNVRLTVYGDNLGDTKHSYGHFITDFGRLEPLAPPLTVGLRVNWDF